MASLPEGNLELVGAGSNLPADSWLEPISSTAQDNHLGGLGSAKWKAGQGVCHQLPAPRAPDSMDLPGCVCVCAPLVQGTSRPEPSSLLSCQAHVGASGPVSTGGGCPSPQGRP